MLLTLVALQVVSLLVRGGKLGDEAGFLIAATVSLSIAAGAIAFSLPPAALNVVRSFAHAVARTPRRAGAFVLLSSFAALTANVFVQQFEAWDEGGLLSAAPIIADRGIEGLIHEYRHNGWLGPQHPPGGPLLYAAGWALGASGPTSLRMVSVLFECGALFVVWRIIERLYGRRAGLLTSTLLLTSPLFVRLGSAVGNDPPLFLFFWLAILCGLRLLDAPTHRRAATLGVVLTLGVLTKYTMVLVGPILLVLPWVTGRRWPSASALAVTAAIPAAFSVCGLFALNGVGMLEAQAGTLEKYVSGLTRFGGTVAATTLLLQLPAAIGVYGIPLALKGVRALEPRTERRDAWLLIWIAAVTVPVALTWPFIRFFVPSFPAIFAVMAIGLLHTTDADQRIRVPLLMTMLCAITLGYYGWADLAVRMVRG